MDLHNEVPKGRTVIQLCYYNSFRNLGEYQRAFECGEMDFKGYVGATCPLCGHVCGYRYLGAYQRQAIELWPFSKHTLSIARFLCRNPGGTFSLLPMQLLPYHRYTLAALISVLLLAQPLAKTRQRHPLSEAALQNPDLCHTEVTPYLFRCWLRTVIQGFRRAHAVLAQGASLSHLVSQTSLRGQLAEVAAYVRAFGSRAPPVPDALEALLRCYTDHALRFSFVCGTPSQHRTPRCGR